MPATYRNPLWDGYCADPFVWRSGDAWYAIGTGDGATEPSAGRLFPLLRSRDFTTWTSLGGALERPDPALGNEFWAPAVAEADGHHYCYYSIGPAHQLRVAIADRPEGPYRDAGALMPAGRTPFAIDAHPFRDDDGTWWLFYARDFLDLDGGWRAGTALAMDRLVGMTRLAGEERVVLRARHDWQLFQRQRTMYGQVWDWHTLEGPCVVKRLGRYWCLYSGACYGNASYGVDWAVADAVTGPWREEGAERGPRLLATVPGHVLGPGHTSIVSGPDGGDWLVYHAWDREDGRRQLCADPLDWTDAGPRCRGPTWAEQPLPARR